MIYPKQNESSKYKNNEEEIETQFWAGTFLPEHMLSPRFN